MHPSTTPSLGRAPAALVVAVCAAALASAFACKSEATDVHDTDEARSGACVSCHSGAYRAAANPVHTDKMPETCQDCHTTKAWSPVDLKDHPWWKIQNKHVGVTCASCHTRGYRAGDTPKDCQGCHRKDYDGAKEPKHVGYPLDCTLCHSDAGFKPSSYKHPWPIDGKHTATPCAGCHTGEPPRYKGTPTACVDCHQKDYDATKSNPLHQGQSTICTDCHTTAGWKPAHVHEWPLEGKHVLVKCSGCHTGNPPKYKGTATDCYACHKAKADASTFPNHATFPHTCLDCHMMSGWKPAITGLHPEAAFALKTGVHSDARIKCQSCHVLAKGTSSGGQNTDCVNCHLPKAGAPATLEPHHARPAIDTRHAQLNVAAYPAVPTTTNFCLGCHPGGIK